MLDCKRNRLDYGELLRPPDGYRFDRAVATTYSADLGTLLSIPIALVYSQTLEGDLTGTRPQLLQAIKQFSQQVRIYHQKGQLHVPAKLNWLHACLEDSLVAVLPDDAFTVFHPKLWVIRYAPTDEESEAQACYRLIVLSRNLTFDRSWDVAASLDGEIGKKFQKTNRPLIDFMHWLDRESPVPQLAETVAELARVEFATPYPFENHVFHPMGIDAYTEHAIASRKSRDTLVMSPFLHKDVLGRLRANTARQFSLFSERHELEKLPTDLLGGMENHHLSDLIVDGERLSNAEEGASDIKQQNLHAKLFLFETKEETSWLLGSANATRAAVEKNVEFMLELRGKAQAIRIRPRLKELTGEEGAAGPFVAFDPIAGGKDDAEERKKQEQTRRFEYALLNSKIHGKVEAAENGKNFDLHLTLELERVPPHSELILTVKPFNTSQGLKPHRLHPGQRETCVFANLAEVELSRFVHFRIESSDGGLQHEFLIRIDIDGLPQDRLDNILRKIIDSSDKFFDYLRFLLADEINKEDLLASVSAAVSPHPAASIAEGWHFHLPIYEQLLVTASRSPRKLAEVDEIIRHLTQGESETVIPEAFLSFWEAFRSLIPRHKSRNSNGP
jgi:hypothetical protein